MARKSKGNEKFEKKILYVTSEAAPFIRTGGLGDVAGSLPHALLEENLDTRVILPLYQDITDEARNTMEYVGFVYVTLSWRMLYCGIHKHCSNGVTYYFIDNEYYFKRKSLYGHFDDGERFAFFSKAVLEAIPLLDFKPDIIHCNDWQTALVPVFLDSFYRENKLYTDIKTVFTIHNIEFQGRYGNDLQNDILGLPPEKASLVEYDGCINFMKGAIESANKVTTVSKTYAKEIFDPFYSYGLDFILKERSSKVSGIVNGIDVKLYNPETDKMLFKNYSCKNIEDKLYNKEGLLKLVGLAVDDAPLIGMVSRLTDQKGIDILLSAAYEFLNDNFKLIILGTGDWRYEEALKDLERAFPHKVKVSINFSGDLASKIYSGSDFFIMPSKFEPCGLSQIISMRYGTIPIVRQTGGLNDTVESYNPETEKGSGFTFYDYNKNELLSAIYRGKEVYENKQKWNNLVKNAMSLDFSWNKSAKEYCKLYKEI